MKNGAEPWGATVLTDGTERQDEILSAGAPERGSAAAGGRGVLGGRRKRGGGGTGPAVGEEMQS